jgi:hypothetical protein
VQVRLIASSRVLTLAGTLLLSAAGLEEELSSPQATNDAIAKAAKGRMIFLLSILTPYRTKNHNKHISVLK